MASVGLEGAREVEHIRHYSLFTPRDFDISPYFTVVKPTIETGFNHHLVKWGSEKGRIEGEQSELHQRQRTLSHRDEHADGERGLVRQARRPTACAWAHVMIRAGANAASKSGLNQAAGRSVDQ